MALDPSPHTYTPTKRNIAHATARAFRISLANAVRDGYVAGLAEGTVTAVLSEATGLSGGELERILSASSLELEDAAHITAGFGPIGFAAYHDAVSTALGEMGPEGWDTPSDP
jgi:hypothetical protein